MLRNILLIVLACTTLSAVAQESPTPRTTTSFASGDQYKERFTLFDNLHYVGIGWVAAYVLTTSDGLILLDSLYGEYVDHLLAGLEELGFDAKDVKYILCTHAHFDHVGGAKRLQDLTGAQVGMTLGDWDMLEAEMKLQDELAKN